MKRLMIVVLAIALVVGSIGAVVDSDKKSQLIAAQKRELKQAGERQTEQDELIRKQQQTIWDLLNDKGFGKFLNPTPNDRSY